MKTRIKVCGLKSMEDVGIMNEFLPDYCGFIIDFPSSHRSITKQVAENLSKELNPRIKTVGVFVNSPVEDVIELLNRGVIQIAQLHGNEDEDYIHEVQAKTNKQVIKAIIVRDEFDVLRGKSSPADYILLDGGKGSGDVFDWSLIMDIKRDFFLAGGLREDNLKKAIQTLHPYGVDLSSSLETDGKKDREKIQRIMKIMEPFR
ncbi:MAG: phosphoribosylanthranilate isomerase [Lachnospiraceae bacterium]|nr:phosphoribosylanthranilate isomerase [Lachnospiraceae bacterium]